jgi:5-bromo-4-chloroindolyl phosphate hydrolysis protein
MVNNDLLTKIGLGSIDIGYIFIGLLVLLIILLILVIVMLAKISKLNKRCNSFMRGKAGKSLEQDIVRLYEDNQILKTGMTENKRDIRSIRKQLTKAFQKIGIVRYNAFQTMGGNLSYSLSLLDENNDGFILNTIHSSEGCYSYTKDIVNGSCNIALSAEEQKAIDMAISSNTK